MEIDEEQLRFYEDAAQGARKLVDAAQQTADLLALPGRLVAAQERFVDDRLELLEDLDEAVEAARAQYLLLATLRDELQRLRLQL